MLAFGQLPDWKITRLQGWVWNSKGSVLAPDGLWLVCLQYVSIAVSTIAFHQFSLKIGPADAMLNSFQSICALPVLKRLSYSCRSIPAINLITFYSTIYSKSASANFPGINIAISTMRISRRQCKKAHLFMRSWSLCVFFLIDFDPAPFLYSLLFFKEKSYI